MNDFYGDLMGNANIQEHQVITKPAIKTITKNTIL